MRNQLAEKDRKHFPAGRHTQTQGVIYNHGAWGHANGLIWGLPRHLLGAEISTLEETGHPDLEDS